MTEKTVAIVAMGNSRDQFTFHSVCFQPPESVMGEVWCVNTMAAVLRCDRAFVMDPAEQLEQHCPAMWARLKHLDVPVYTTDPGRYKNGVPYPIGKVIKALSVPYFNNTVAYALGLAIVEGYKNIALYGADFTYPHIHHGEQGRGNVEYLVGRAVAMGCNVSLPPGTTLLDMNQTPQLYGWQREPGNENAGCLTPPEVMAVQVEKYLDRDCAEILLQYTVNNRVATEAMLRLARAGNPLALELIGSAEQANLHAIENMRQVALGGDPANVTPAAECLVGYALFHPAAAAAVNELVQVGRLQIKPPAVADAVAPPAAVPVAALPAGAATTNVHMLSDPPPQSARARRRKRAAAPAERLAAVGD